MGRAKKIINVLLKVLLSLILITPIFGVIGVFPEPTRELYNTDEAFNFIQVLMRDANYIQYFLAIVFIVSAVLLWIKREALSAFLIAPITLNILGFHLFLDGGLLTKGAIMGNILFLLNIYLLWEYRAQYSSLLKKRKS